MASPIFSFILPFLSKRVRGRERARSFSCDNVVKTNDNFVMFPSVDFSCPFCIINVAVISFNGSKAVTLISVICFFFASTYHDKLGCLMCNFNYVLENRFFIIRLWDACDGYQVIELYELPNPFKRQSWDSTQSGKRNEIWFDRLQKEKS